MFHVEYDALFVCVYMKVQVYWCTRWMETMRRIDGCSADVTRSAESAKIYRTHPVHVAYVEIHVCHFAYVDYDS